MVDDLRVGVIYPVMRVWKTAKMAWRHANEEGSVSGAARKLRMAQPTLSRRLATLERAVGESLFRRSASGAALTIDWTSSAGDTVATRERE